MPKVGSKEFEYSQAGEAAAKREAERTGKPVKMHGAKRRPRRSGGKRK